MTAILNFLHFLRSYCTSDTASAITQNCRHQSEISFQIVIYSDEGWII
jgi:hypothetical protein